MNLESLGSVDPRQDPNYEIRTPEQARNWVLELVDVVKEARLNCNVVIPDDKQATARRQQAAFRQFLVKHGLALGALVTLHRTGKIGDVMYNELNDQVISTFQASVVGVVRG